MLNGKVDDARDVVFADPTDMDSPEFSLEMQIEYAEFNLQCAISHLDDLMRQKAELDACIDAEYQEHLDREYGRVACESDSADREIAEVSRC